MVFPVLFDPVPAELGTTEDPIALVPGNPASIDSKLVTLRKLATGIDEASAAFTKIDEGQWKGAAGDAFRNAFSQEVPHWRNSAQAFDEATRALQEHRTTLAAAQKQAAEAVDRYNKGVQATEKARNQYNAAVNQHNVQAAQGVRVAAMAPFSDPGESDRQEAQEILDEARKKVRQSGAAAAAVIGAARDSAPQGPGFLERLGASMGDFFDSQLNFIGHAGLGALSAAGGVAKAIDGVANPLMMLTHPTEALENAGNMASGLLYSGTHPVDLMKGFVDYNEWGKDPAAAIGNVGVNIATIFTGGEGTAAKAVEVGADGAKAAEVAGDAAKAAEAGDAGKVIAQGGHDFHPASAESPWMKGDLTHGPDSWWTRPDPTPDAPFGPQGSESLSHDPDPLPDHPFGPQGSPATHDLPHGDHTPPSHHPEQPVDHTPPPVHHVPDQAAITQTMAELERARAIHEEFLGHSDIELERMSPAERQAFHQQAGAAFREVRRLQQRLDDLKAGRV